MELKQGYKQTEVGLIPRDWNVVPMLDVARLESGHTPSKSEPSYWDGNVQWVSLHDSEELNQPEICSTRKTITDLGLANSSARLLPKGTVVFSRTATVGKATILGRSMATSQDFAAYVCGPELHNRYLLYLFRGMGKTWRGLMAGSTHSTIYMPAFRSLKIPLPSLQEQRLVADAFADIDALLSGIDTLIAKQRDLKTAAMQQLLTGKTRLPGFGGKWETKRLGDVGTTYGGLVGKSKVDFGHGAAQYVTFLNVMTNVVIDIEIFDNVDLRPNEVQNRVLKGDLLFNGSSETPEEVAMCALVDTEIEHLYLNSFCFGFRMRPDVDVHGRFMAYYLRSMVGRELIKSLAQGSTRYNLSKTAFLNGRLEFPSGEEQAAIAEVLSDMDVQLTALEQQREKTALLKQGMMQELLTGRTRLI